MKKSARVSAYLPVILGALTASVGAVLADRTAHAMEFYADRRDFDLQQGSSHTTAIEIDRYGFVGPIAFAVSAASGLTVTITPNPAYGNTATATFSAAATASVAIQYLTITATAGDEVRGQDFEINVTPGAATQPRLSASPASVAFPATLIGVAVPNRLIAISNTGAGTTPAVISAVSLSGADASRFAIRSTSYNGARLLPGASCSITVAAASPGTARAHSASVGISSSAGDLSVPVTLHGTDYSLSLSPTSVSLSPGSSAPITIRVTRSVNPSAAAAGPIAISVTGLPTGVSAASVAVASGAKSAVLTLQASAAAPVTGTPVLARLTAAPSARTKTVNLPVGVLAAGSLSLSVTPNPVRIAPGHMAAITVSIRRTGFGGSVSLSLTGTPSGVTASTISTTGNTASLSISVSAATAAATYPLTVRGVSGSITKTTALSLVVSAAAPDIPWRLRLPR
ncbi:MAG: hypothetical protein HYV63_11375 [Candidatus Schekmanbacteria bacterium]|nr:hypothetical protein [Candidatus Schekmanbacteria bacterium]